MLGVGSSGRVYHIIQREREREIQQPPPPPPPWRRKRSGSITRRRAFIFLPSARALPSSCLYPAPSLVETGPRVYCHFHIHTNTRRLEQQQLRGAAKRHAMGNCSSHRSQSSGRRAFHAAAAAAASGNKATKKMGAN